MKRCAQCNLLLLALPVAGTGYDVPRFARDLRSFQDTYGHAVAVAAPQESVRRPFESMGVAAFAREREAMDALLQVAAHTALQSRPPRVARYRTLPASATASLDEAQSLARLASAGLPVIEHRLCRTEAQVQAAAAVFGPVAVKACSPDLPHKSDHGLVALGSGDPVAEFARMRTRVAELGARFEGAIVARLAPKGHELALGARWNAQFGPVVLVGDGGVHLEALKDFRLLLPPFDEAEVLEKLGELRVAPLLGALRGRPARDVQAFARMAVRLGEAMLEWNGAVTLIDVNPVVVFETGRGAVAVDALVECRLIISAP